MSLHVIDVSSAQPNINIKNINCDCVIVKATEGTTYVNPDFEKQVSDTLASGKQLGIYHFISNNDDIEKQVQYFYDHVKQYIGRALFALDFENDEETKSYIINQQGVGKALEFLQSFENRTKIKPLIYLSLAVENNSKLDWSRIVSNGNACWIAQYNLNPPKDFTNVDLYGKLSQFKSMAMHQYTSKGRLAGYNADLDLSFFFGDKTAWGKYGNATVNPAPKPQPTPPSAPQWISENKSYTLKTAVYLHTAATTTSPRIALLAAGSTIKTDRCIIINGYRWVRQPRAGAYGYMATGPVGDTLKYVK